MYLPELRIERKKLIAEIRAIRDETRPRKFRVVEGDYQKHGETVHFRRTYPVANSSRCRNPLLRQWLLQGHLLRAKKRLRVNHIVAGAMNGKHYDEIEQGARNWPDFEEIRATYKIQMNRIYQGTSDRKEAMRWFDQDWMPVAVGVLKHNQREYLTRRSGGSSTITSDAAGSVTRDV
jgi:hypothetical protein